MSLKLSTFRGIFEDGGDMCASGEHQDFGIPSCMNDLSKVFSVCVGHLHREDLEVEVQVVQVLLS